MSTNTLRIGAALCAAMASSAAIAQAAEDLGPAPLIWSSPYTGRISAIACSPSDPGRYYAAGADGGVWRTTDGGDTWTPITDHLPTTAIGALAIDPADESTIYAGSGEANFANHSRYGLGLYKSTDGGDSWAVLAADTFSGRCFSKIVIDPANTQRLFAGITRAGGFPEMAAAKSHPQREGPLGVFRSEDGGVTWTHLTNGLPALTATDLAINPADPQVVYAAIGHIFGSADNGVYKTTDGGESWTRLGGGLPSPGQFGRIALAIAPSMPSRVYALAAKPSDAFGGGAANLGGWRSDNGGESWTSIGGVYQASYGWYLCVASVHPTDPGTIVFGGFELRRSINAGQSWNTVTPPHVDMHAIAWDAAGRLLVGDDGGVHRSENVGNSWIHRNDGLGTVQFYAGLSTRPDNDEWVFGGTQDNGTNRRSQPGKVWSTRNGGDGGWTQVDPFNADVCYAESQGTGNLARSTDGADSFKGFGGGLDGRNCFLPPYIVDPNTPDRLIYGTERVFERIVGQGLWTPISPDLTSGPPYAIRALAIAPSDSSYVYAATNDGRVLVSKNYGHDFTIILQNNPGWPRVTRELRVHPAKPETLYLAVAAFDTDQVRVTHDAGQTWTALDGDLPDTPVNVIALDARTDPPILYAGADGGVFRSLDHGLNWTRFGDDIPNAAVIDLIFEPERERLVVGTQGRGAWRISTAAPPCPADCDQNGDLTLFDYFCFQTAFNAMDPYADLDGDSQFTLFDFLAYQNLFLQGCP